jgi:hypothetical protein
MARQKEGDKTTGRSTKHTPRITETLVAKKNTVEFKP